MRPRPLALAAEAIDAGWTFVELGSEGSVYYAYAELPTSDNPLGPHAFTGLSGLRVRADGPNLGKAIAICSERALEESRRRALP